MVVTTKPNIPSRTDQVVEQLQALIRSSDLQPGDAFATEAELQERFNVSRHVIRDAVGRLRALGILESRQSLGLIVARADPAGLFEKAINSWGPGSADLRELGILRYTLEIGAVQPAVKWATDEQLVTISRIAEELAEKQLADAPLEEVVDTELRFHGSILAQVHSPLLMQMHQVLVAFFAKETKDAKEDRNFPSEEESRISAMEHREIAEAFARRDVERARAVLSEHLALLISDENRRDLPRKVPGKKRLDRPEGP